MEIIEKMLTSKAEMSQTCFNEISSFASNQDLAYGFNFRSIPPALLQSTCQIYSTKAYCDPSKLPPSALSSYESACTSAEGVIDAFSVGIKING